jgi:hypothetical protein
LQFVEINRAPSDSAYQGLSRKERPPRRVHHLQPATAKKESYEQHAQHSNA